MLVGSWTFVGLGLGYTQSFRVFRPKVPSFFEPSLQPNQGTYLFSKLN